MSETTEPGPAPEREPVEREGALRIALSSPLEILEPGELGEEPKRKPVHALFAAPLRVGHLREAPVQGIRYGDLMTIGARTCGLKGSVEVLQSTMRGIPAAELSRLVVHVERELAVYSAAAEAIQQSGELASFEATHAFRLELRQPVQLGSEAVALLELQPMTVGDLWDLPTGPEGLSIYAQCHLGVKMARQLSAVGDLLRMEDAGRLSAVVMAFFLGFQATGPT